jgi:subtilisin family serine protease
LLAASLLSLGVGLVPALAANHEATSATNSAWLRADVSAQRLHTLLPHQDGAIDYGRFQWIPASAANQQVLRSAGVTITPFERAFELDLGGQRFDPLLAPPASTATTQSGETGWYLVQFRGPIKPEWLVHLRDAGAAPAQYIHPYTYVVWSDAAALTRARDLAEVRWSGAFAPEFKLAAGQRHFDATPRPTMVLSSRHQDAMVLRDAIAALGGAIGSSTPLDTHFQVMHLEVPGDRYMDLAALPGIYTVQDIPPETALRGEMSSQSIVGNYGIDPPYTIVPGYRTWLDTLGFDGTGVVVAVVDGGVRTTHQDLASRMVACVPSGASPTSCSTSNNAHGTHVAGAIAGAGSSGVLLNGFLRGLGVAPDANLVQQRYNSFLGGGPGSMIADGMLKIYKESSLSGAVLTNNSWGPTGSPQGYDIPTQQIDIVTRDANPDVPGNQQVLNVWSIMNGGGDGFGACAPSSLGSPDEAKNLFAVGSTSLQNGSTGAQLSTIFNVSSNSAHGNACDGRRVPNIVAPGCSTDSTAAGGDTAFSFDFCGTSMASPVVSGASAVFVDKYRSEHAGATPSPAMIKAAFTAVAKDLEGFRNADNGIMGHRPDRFQGYGRIDLDATVNSPDAVFSLDQSELLAATGANWTGTLNVADPLRPVRIMLAWTDAKGHGNGGSTPAWVNNLDLTVSSNGASYRGNVIGGDGWSATGGSADDRNNLEGVFLRPDQLGTTVDIEVLAANLAADAINPYTPGAPAQDFALICYNCSNAPLGSADLALGLSALPDPVQAGDPLTILATVVNFGADAASGIRFDLSLPDGVDFVSAQLQSGSGTWSCSALAQAVTCTMTAGELPTGAFSSVLEIATLVDPVFTGSSMQATGEVGAAQFIDSLPDNNQATLQIHVGDIIFANGYD